MKTDRCEDSELTAQILLKLSELPPDRQKIFKKLCVCFARYPGFQAVYEAIIPSGEPAPTWGEIEALVNTWYTEAPA